MQRLTTETKSKIKSTIDFLKEISDSCYSKYDSEGNSICTTNEIRNISIVNEWLEYLNDQDRLLNVFDVGMLNDEEEVSK